MSENPSLTDREIEILQELATGASNREIAQTLSISANTVKVHVRNIFEKLDVASRTEATLVAIQSGLVEGVESDVVMAQPAWWQRGPVIAGGVLVTVMLAILIAVLVSPGGPPAQNTVDLEALEQERWQELAPMPTARKGLAVAAYDGKIYAIAGETEQGVTGVVERYDPETDTWETLPSKPTPVTDVEAAVIGGKIYVPGGCTDGSKGSETVEVFDPHSEQWETAPSLPLGVCSYALSAYEGDLYLFGGYADGNLTDQVFSFTASTPAWMQLAPLPKPIAGGGSVAISNGIYVLGAGSDKAGPTSNWFFQPDILADQADTWIERESLPERRVEIGVGGIADVIYLFGGETTQSGPGGFRYIPAVDVWNALVTPFNESWSDMGTVVVETKMYAFGGDENGKILNRSMSYTLAYTLLIPIVR